MQPNRKQEIYIQIMEMVLPYLRNLEKNSTSHQPNCGTFYAELELIHNLARCLACPEFTKNDGFWVATQGVIYIKRGRRDIPFYEFVCELIREIDGMVPTEMRQEFKLPPLPKQNGK